MFITELLTMTKKTVSNSKHSTNGEIIVHHIREYCVAIKQGWGGIKIHLLE